MIRILTILFLALTTPAHSQERAANHLLGASSPYLLQHLYNPVDWYPWGEEALEKALDENKMVFVSIGYASCHWCHVMRKESFENPEIAALLNANFVAIKIDREERPDLDEQFMLATRILTGTGGWPNNLLLTPLGDPVFAATYLPPEDLTELLMQMNASWRKNPEAIQTEGARLTRYLKAYLTRQAAAVELTAERLAAINAGLLAQMDEFHGGIGTTVKFPRESLFLYLNDAARRGEGAAREAVVAALDGMIAGGIHDEIGGGFHRYAVDPAWHVPHFEKMLYNQARIGLLLIRSIADLPNEGHARALERLIAYLMREMRAPGGALYAAQDADSLIASGEDKREGAYYLWTPRQVITVLGETDGAWINQVFDIGENGEVDGANVLHLPGPLPDPARLDPLLARLAEARAKRPTPDTDRKILLGWNGAIIAMLAEAAQVTGHDEYWQAGATAARDLLATLKTGDGYQRVVFDGSANLPAQLPDLGAFALGLIALHDYAPEGEEGAPWLAEARAIGEIIRTSFGSLDQGLRMSMQPDGFSPIIAIDDGELASGNAMALMVLSRLSRRLEAPELDIDAHRLAATLSGFGAEAPNQRAGALMAVRELREGESGPVRYVSGGAVRVAMRQSGDQVSFELSMKPGWHVNAHVPLEDYFIATELLIADTPLPADAYPQAQIKALGFNPVPLALYEGRFTLRAKLPEGRPISARLILQSCSEEICLAPETLVFTLW